MAKYRAVQPSLLDTLLWIASALAQLAVLRQIRRRRIARKYLTLTAYLVFWLSEFVIAFPLHQLGFYRAYYYLYWASTALSAILSLLMVIEVIIHKLQADAHELPRSLAASGVLVCALVVVGTDLTRVTTSVILNLNFQARIIEAAFLAVFFTLCISRHQTSGLDFDIAFGLSAIVSSELIEHFIVSLYPAAESFGNYAIVASSLLASAVWLRGAIAHPEFNEIDLSGVLATDYPDVPKQTNEGESEPEEPLKGAGTLAQVQTLPDEAQKDQCDQPAKKPKKRRSPNAKKIRSHASELMPQRKAVRPQPMNPATLTPRPAQPGVIQSPATMALIPPTDHGELKGRYKIGICLGIGSYGMAYKAYDNVAKRYVALKFVLPQIKDDHRVLERFRREVAIASRLRHKNICQVYGLIETNLSTSVVMEFVSGRNLGRFVFENRQEAEIAALVPVFIEIADGLSYAHSQGVIHRDIKPDNIMFSKAGLVKIVDFGIAKSTLGDLPSTTGDPPRGALGYTAPELLQGQAANPQSDVYSLGCLMYTLATGQYPFIDQSRKVGWEQAILDNNPKRPTWINPNIPQDLERIIMRAMVRDRSQRYSSATHLLIALQSLVQPPSKGKSAKRKVPNQ